MDPFADRLELIDPAVLAPPVRMALGRKDAAVVAWQYAALHGASFNSGIYRFSGSAKDHEQLLPWSLILKITRSPDQKDDPTCVDYWKREALAYQSGLLDDLPDAVRAPRCLGILEPSNLESWIWLEEVIDELPAAWPLEQYGRVAHHLAQLNVAYLNKPHWLNEPWLARGRLRAWVDGSMPVTALSAGLRAHPLNARLYPDDIYQRMLRAWPEREAWMALIEAQPQTLAHLDAFRRNVFARRGPRGSLHTVLIDWSLAGSAALGEDIAPLVAASLNFLEASTHQAQALDQTVFDAYMEGLEQAGWRGDRRVVRFTYAASAVLRYSIGVLGVTSMIADEQQHAILEQAFGHPLEELVDAWSQTNRFLYDLADEARSLLPLIR